MFQLSGFYCMLIRAEPYPEPQGWLVDFCLVSGFGFGPGPLWYKGLAHEAVCGVGCNVGT